MGKGIKHCFSSADNSSVADVPVGRGQLWTEYFDEYYPLTIAMIFGSLIAYEPSHTNPVWTRYSVGE